MRHTAVGFASVDAVILVMAAPAAAHADLEVVSATWKTPQTIYDHHALR